MSEAPKLFMILALDKYDSLYVFSSATDAERGLEAIDVQESEFQFCNGIGQLYSIVYTIPPRVSRLGPFRTIDIGAFKLSIQCDTDPTLPERFIERATHIEHTSIPAFTSVDVLRDEIRRLVR